MLSPVQCLVFQCDRAKITSGINTAWIFKRRLSLFLFRLVSPLPRMTSSNLQRWISPFPWNLNMKGDCETYQGSWGAGVEYHSMCISLAFGSLNDVSGNIKSSIAPRALIWIVKTTLAVNRMQPRKKNAPHPTDCETDQWIFDQQEIASDEGFSAEISHFL